MQIGALLGYWALAVAGSVLVLTQSSILRPAREWLADVAARATGRRAAVLRGAAKLVSCPMCSGSWLGAIWAASMGLDAAGVFWLFWGGSYIGAMGVGLWQVVAEAHSAIVLWRYNNTPSED